FPGEDDVEYASANTEYLQQTNPDVILRAAHGMPEAVVEMFDKEFAESDVWKHFDAVENGRVYDLEETLFGTTANLAAHEALVHLLDILYEE
ncbi:MAG TPA: ABC transporter substrate-binding protein, partial [Pseudogracilibacillus sp.]|nr:ABC transporter substrate-binding protein [Pseudogracilibacillus sp.]